MTVAMIEKEVGYPTGNIRTGSVQTSNAQANGVQADSIEHEKLDLIQWITTLDELDLDVVRQLGDFKARYFTDSVSISEAEHESILAGFLDIEAGRLTPHSEVRATYEQWL